MEGGAESSAAYDTVEQQAREDHRTLLSSEVFWRDHQVWLAEQGYMLRPRYRPDWVPSWTGTGKAWRRHEDGIALWVCATTILLKQLLLTSCSTPLS